MNIDSRNIHIYITKISDIIISIISLSMSLWIYELLHGQDISLPDLLHIKIKMINIISLLVYLLIYNITLHSIEIYDHKRIQGWREEYRHISKIVLASSSLLLIIMVTFQRGNISKDVILIFSIFTCILTFLGRFVTQKFVGWVHRQNRKLRNILLIGWNKRAYDFTMRILEKPQLGYRIIGFLDVFSEKETNRRFDLYLECLGTLADFDYVIDHVGVDEVVVSLPIRSFYEHISYLIEHCETQGIEVHLLSNFFEMKIARSQIDEFDGIPVLTFKTNPISIWQSYVKRSFDLIVASMIMIPLAPIYLLAAILIKLLSPGGPIFFVQTRIGYNRHHFKMMKFRTMVPNAAQLQKRLENLNEAQGPVFKIKDDPRITPIGRFLRQTSIDELPQLFNVIKGDMSLVGPRPLPLRDVARFEESWLKRRFSVKPGITCLWQINGRSNSSFDTWIKQDLEYIDNWSFGLDLKILVKTIPSVFRGSGAY